MMVRSRQRNTSQNKVIFINAAIENVYPDTKFDVILTPFVFDNFNGETADKVFRHLHQLLKPAGLWLNCDFQLTGKWWQTILLKSMFLFFRLICGIEASKLPDVQRLFASNNYQATDHKCFYGDFVTARAYKLE